MDMFLSGVASGVLLSLMWVKLWWHVRVWRAVRQMEATSGTPPPHVETYGHAVDLVGELQAHLPPPPPRMLWESGVRYVDSEPELWLSLLDTTLNQTVAETSKSLVRRGPDNLLTWVEDYYHYGPAYTAQKARREIVIPLLHWAAAEVNKRKDDGIERYGISG